MDHFHCNTAQILWGKQSQTMKAEYTVIFWSNTQRQNIFNILKVLQTTFFFFWVPNSLNSLYKWFYIIWILYVVMPRNEFPGQGKEIFSCPYSNMQTMSESDDQSKHCWVFFFFFCKAKTPHGSSLKAAAAATRCRTKNCCSLSANHQTSAGRPRWAITAAEEGWRRGRDTNICHSRFRSTLLLHLQWALLTRL